MKEKKLYSLRLYKTHDIDLLYLSSYPSISIQKLIAESVRSYIRKKEFSINVPIYNVSDKKISSKQIKVYFNPDRDADVIQILDKVPSHRLSAVIKSITRMYLDKALIDYCMSSEIDIPDEKPVRKKQPERKANFTKLTTEKTENKNVPVIEETTDENDDTSSDSFFLDMEKMLSY